MSAAREEGVPGATLRLRAAAAEAAGSALPERIVVSGFDAGDLPSPREAISRVGPPRLLWKECDGGFGFAALGELARVTADGPGRFARVGAAAAELARRIEGADAARELPWLVGGFCFDAAPPDPGGPWSGLSAAQWTVPRALLWERGEERRLAVAVPAAHGEGPGAIRRRIEAQCAAVRAALARPTPHGGVRPGASPWPARASAATEGSVGARAHAGAGTAHPTPASAEAQRDEAARRSFVERVARAREAIRRGELEKVVVARAQILERWAEPGAHAARVQSALHALDRPEEGSRLFAWDAGAGVLVGRTPERLLSVHGQRVEAEALAGSTRRGRDGAEDARLARALRESKKEQEEHALVVRALAEALAPWCDPLQVPEAPRVRTLAGIQHLSTPIRGGLAHTDPAPLFALAARLHPTPAVAGRPREAALAFLRAHERMERGAYAGLLGWTSPSGRGELVVALRCALIQPTAVLGFAGAGVVAGSDPEAELAETDLKMATVARALAAARP